MTWQLGDHTFSYPLLASAMDGVVNPTTAGLIGKIGGLGVLNLEGIQSRYVDADQQLEKIAGFAPADATRGLQEVYRTPVDIDLMVQRISTGSPFEAKFGYSRAVRHEDTIYVSGTTGYDYATMKMPDGVGEQARNALATIDKALREAG